MASDRGNRNNPSLNRRDGYAGGMQSRRGLGGGVQPSNRLSVGHTPSHRPSEGQNQGSSQTQGHHDPPRVMRTICRRPVKGITHHTTYSRDIKEDEYDTYQNSTSDSAIELRKDALVIPPSSLSSSKEVSSKEGEDIIDSIVSERIIIRSQHLIECIKEVVTYWPSKAYYDGQTKLELDRPYRSIAVYRDAFDEKQKQFETEIKELREDEKSLSEEDKLRLMRTENTSLLLIDLLKEVDKVSRDLVRKEKRLHENTDNPQATFEMLSMLFKPGDLVYVKSPDFEGACRVNLLVWGQGLRSGAAADDPFMKVAVRLWYLDHDGTHISRRHHMETIDRFHGPRSIHELSVIPMKFAIGQLIQPLDPTSSTETTIEKTLVERGKKFCQHLKSEFSHCTYAGPLSRHEWNPYLQSAHSFVREERRTWVKAARTKLNQFSGKVIVDPAYYYREKGGIEKAKWVDDSDRVYYGPSKVAPSKPLHLDPEQSIFDNDHYMLLPKWVRAFTIGTRGTRDWAWVNIDGLSTYKYDPELIKTVGFSNEADLDDLKAMTYRPDKGHTGQESLAEVFKADSIEEKGEGRMIILQGPPGLGKTYTVESIAEWSGRPLLRLTCAELGLKPTSLESTLNRQLRRAERWKAIALIDEADLFLEERRPDHPLDKEAIVAVFLRALEYYSGIMFLTTNRVKHFDEAALNRMILVIQFDPPNEATKLLIINNCLARLKSQKQFEVLPEAAKAFQAIATTNLLESYQKDLTDSAHPASSLPTAWTGREIVSVFKRATALAQYRLADSNSGLNHAHSIIVEEEHVTNAIERIMSAEKRLSEKLQASRPMRQSFAGIS